MPVHCAIHVWDPFLHNFSGVYGNLHPIVYFELQLIGARWYSSELPEISFRISSNAIAFREMISILFCCLTTHIRSLMIGPRETRKCLWSSNRHEMKHFYNTTKEMARRDERKDCFPKPRAEFNFLWCAVVIIPNRLIAGLIQFQFSVMIWLLSVSRN